MMEIAVQKALKLRGIFKVFILSLSMIFVKLRFEFYGHAIRGVNLLVKKL
jgi:hypothetical protein